MNIAESERMRTMLAGENDLVVVNSCAVTGEALSQTRKGNRRARRDHPSARPVVTGCASAINRAEIGAIDEVDALVANAAKLDPRAWNIAADAPPFTRTGSLARTRAFVAVQREIEAHLLVGTNEIVLSGVDLNSWGHDLTGAPRLSELVTAILTTFPTLPRQRRSSVDGVEVDPAPFELLAHELRVMLHLHLSLQRAAALRKRSTVRRTAWLTSLVGETLPVLAERDGTGYAPNYARVALPPGTAAGEIIEVTPSGLREGLLA